MKFIKKSPLIVILNYDYACHYLYNINNPSVLRVLVLRKTPMENVLYVGIRK